MKTVTIPTIGADPLVITINNAEYRYKAGITTSVPDEVAAVIDNIIANLPKEAPAPGKKGQVWTRQDNGAAWGNVPNEIPSVPQEDGRYLTSFDGMAVWSRLVVPEATGADVGGVLKGAAVADATDETDVVTQLNALIASLVASGAIAAYTSATSET